MDGPQGFPLNSTAATETVETVPAISAVHSADHLRRGQGQGNSRLRRRRAESGGVGVGSEDGHGDREAAGSRRQEFRRTRRPESPEGGYFQKELEQLGSDLRGAVRRRRRRRRRKRVSESFGGSEKRVIDVSADFRGLGRYQTRLPDHVRQRRVFQDDRLHLQRGYRPELVM